MRDTFVSTECNKAGVLTIQIVTYSMEIRHH